MSSGRIEIKTRPLKFAFLVNEQNQDDIIRAMEINSFLWGGTYNPIIPYLKSLDGHWKKDALGYPPLQLVQNYLTLFDPDVIVTVGNVSAAEELKKTFADVEFIGEKEIFGEADRTGLPKYGIGLFEIMGKLYEDEFKFMAKNPPKVTFPDLQEDKLFTAAFAGTLSEKIRKGLLNSFANYLNIEQPVLTKENYFSILGTMFPRMLSGLYLGDISKRMHEYSQAIILVDPASTTDILDYWNLRANGWKIFPVPVTETVSVELKKIILDFIDEYYREIPFSVNVYARTTLLKGRSVSNQQFESFSRQVSPLDAQGKSVLADKIFFQSWMPRMWIDWAEKSDHLSCCEIESETQTLNLNETSEQIRFDVLVPSFFHKKVTRYSEALFCNEVDYSFYGSSKLVAEVIPYRLQKFAVGYTAWRYDIRAARNYVTYLPNRAYTNLYFKLPEARDILKKWFKQAGYQVEDSYAGLIAEQMFQKLEGEHGILHTILKRGFIELLDKFSNEKSLRYAAVIGELKKMKNLGEYEYPEKDFLANMLEKSVLDIGFEIQCPVCTQHNWYHMDSLRREMECTKCLSAFQSPVSSPGEMHFAYKAKGTFSLPNQSYGSYAVLLTHYFFSDTLDFPTTAAFGILLKHDNAEYEIDYTLFGKERKSGFEETVNILAECKTFNSFSQDDVDRMEKLGSLFPQSVLLFASVKLDLNPEEKEMIRALIHRNKEKRDKQQPFNRILILTGHELRGYSRPPDSWPEKLKSRDPSINYENVYDIDSLCSATQKLHIANNN